MPLPVVKMLKDLSREYPKLKGAIDYIVGELNVGNISEETAKRATNYAERMGRFNDDFNWERHLKGLKDAGDINTARGSVIDAAPDNVFKDIDERITEYDLGGTKRLNKDKIKARKDVVDFGRQTGDTEAISDWAKEFEAAEKRYRDLELDDSDMLTNRSIKGLEGPSYLNSYRNAIKSGLSKEDAIREAVDIENSRSGKGVSFREVAEYLRDIGEID